MYMLTTPPTGEPVPLSRLDALFGAEEGRVLPTGVGVRALLDAKHRLDELSQELLRQAAELDERERALDAREGFILQREREIEMHDAVRAAFPTPTVPFWRYIWTKLLLK